MPPSQKKIGQSWPQRSSALEGQAWAFFLEICARAAFPKKVAQSWPQRSSALEEQAWAFFLETLAGVDHQPTRYNQIVALEPCQHTQGGSHNHAAPYNRGPPPPSESCFKLQEPTQFNKALQVYNVG